MENIAKREMENAGADILKLKNLAISGIATNPYLMCAAMNKLQTLISEPEYLEFYSFLEEME